MKEIKDFPGYFVTEEGKILSAWNKKSIRNNKGIIITVDHYIDYNNLHELKLSKNTTGYLKINLTKNKKIYTKTVHRLVAESYIQNPYNLPVINHKNEIKDDNRIKNLEWCTQQYNSEYSNSKNKKGRD